MRTEEDSKKSLVVRSFFTLSGMTLISRALGVIREALLSHYLGASIEMDAFLSAFKLPSFFRKCFAEGGMQSIFVPYYCDYTASNKRNAANIFASKVFSVLFWVMLAVTALVVIFAPEIVSIFAPGFMAHPDKFNLTVEFTRITFPNIFFVAIASVYSAILMSYNRFFAFSFGPILVNIVLILAVLMPFGGLSEGYRISYGVLIGAICQFVFLWASLKLTGFKVPRIVSPKPSPKTKSFFRKLVPVIAGAGVVQVNVFVDTLFVSFLPTGYVSFIYFADRFIQLPLAMFGISMATALLPEISKNFSKGNTEEMIKIQNKSLLFILRMTIPSVFGLIILSYFLVDFLYGHGKFGAESVATTAHILSIFALGLPAYVIAKVFATGLFAQKDSKTPIRAAIVSIVFNVLMIMLLIKKFGAYGVAASTAMSGYVNAYVMYSRSKRWHRIDSDFKRSLSRIILAGIGMSVILFLGIQYIPYGINKVYEIILLIVFGAVGIVIYFLFLLLQKDRWAKDAFGKIQKQLSMRRKQ